MLRVSAMSPSPTRPRVDERTRRASRHMALQAQAFAAPSRAAMPDDARAADATAKLEVVSANDIYRQQRTPMDRPPPIALI